MSVITPYQRNVLLSADRSRDVEVVYEAIGKVTLDNPFATLLDIEMVFRDAAANSYLIIDKDAVTHIVFGMEAWHAKLTSLAIDSADNWASLIKLNHARLAQHR
jgi:hypothetical protein